MRWRSVSPSGLRLSADRPAARGHLGSSLHPPAPAKYDPALFLCPRRDVACDLRHSAADGVDRLRAVPLGLLHTAVTTVALFETASLSAKVSLSSVGNSSSRFTPCRACRWAGLALLALAAVATPFAFPLTVGAATSCWLTEHKPSPCIASDLEFRHGFIHQSPVVGWDWTPRANCQAARPRSNCGFARRPRMPAGCAEQRHPAAASP